jgi:NTP pyrophosphatase (non-canonical NTP hydrolase)
LDFKEYGEKARATRDQNNKAHIIYPAFGLGGETGEVLELVKKSLRPGGVLVIKDVIEELGDVLWYISAFADDLGSSIEDVAKVNIDKLAARHADRISVPQADGDGGVNEAQATKLFDGPRDGSDTTSGTRCHPCEGSLSPEDEATLARF